MRVNWDVSKYLKLNILLIPLCILFLFMMFSLSSFAENRIKLGTTTSVQDTGLLDKLLPEFEKETGLKVDVIAVGSGKAFKLGESGDVDVILVHDKNGEIKFVNAGYGVNRKGIMHNDFIILGPKKDPASVKKAKTALDAFKTIYKNKALFISRGDDSGTNRKEKQLWSELKIKPEGEWYREAGQGMSAVIFMADNQKAYTLSDRGTYLAVKDKIDLNLLYQGDPKLKNYYSVIVINPKKNKNVKYNDAMKFAKFLTSKKAQEIIKNFKKSGQQMFYPDVIK